jgi:hypothetical protein
MSSLKPEDSRVVMQKLLDAVGAGAVDDFDFSEENWFWKYTWTSKQEEEFEEWLAKFLVKKGYARKGLYRDTPHGLHQARKITMNYGWKIKDGN